MLLAGFLGRSLLRGRFLCRSLLRGNRCCASFRLRSLRCLYGNLRSLERLSARADFRNAYLGERLSVSVQLLVLLLAFKVKDQNLVGAALSEDLANDFGILGFGDLAFFAADCQDFEINVLVAVRRLFNLNDVTGSDTILLTASADHRVHSNASMNLLSIGGTTIRGGRWSCSNQFCALALPRRSRDRRQIQRSTDHSRRRT